MARGLGTRGRFAVAYLLLGAAAGVAAGGLIVLVQRSGPQPAPAWSSWQPAASATDSRVLEIAQHVASSYRLPSGDQLVAVKVGGSQNGNDFGGVAIVKKDNARALDKSFQPENTAVFILCGDNPNTCAITQGAPTIARGTVLRREALELALYTMEYADPIDNVLIFFPPGKGESKLTSTLFFSRDDLSGSLEHPLRRTLPQSKPPLPGQIVPREKKTVNDLTASKLYRYLGITQNVIVIQQPPSAAANT
jgi:hypothetical protein